MKWNIELYTKLQAVQNATAGIIYRLKKYDHINHAHNNFTGYPFITG